MDVDDRGTQSGGGERSNAGNLKQSFDDGVVFIEVRELAVDVLAALRESIDLNKKMIARSEAVLRDRVEAEPPNPVAS